MKLIAWKASYTVGGWRTIFATHGDVSVPNDATEAQIDAAIREDMLKAFRFERLAEGDDA